MANIAFKKIGNNKYNDIYAENGSLAITKGLWSQVQMSLLNDKRANDSQIVIKHLQRGWLGNQIANDVPEFEIGSLIWLVIDQNNITDNNLQDLKRFAKDSLNWLIEDEYAEDIKTKATDNRDGSVSLDITLVINQNNIIKRKFNLWLSTFYP